MLLVIVVVILILYRRKSSESSRVLKNMQEQMDVLELRVAAECKEGGCSGRRWAPGRLTSVLPEVRRGICEEVVFT